MPESKSHATARAKSLGFPKSHVVKGKNGYFIAPKGLKHHKAAQAYADMRSKGMSKSNAAKIAHSIDNKV